MERKQVAGGELQFGMCVVELDRPWTDRPFMFQGFHLRTDQQLTALKKFCKHVFIDLARTESIDGKPPPAQFKVKGSTAYPEKASVEAEFKQAANVYGQS